MKKLMNQNCWAYYYCCASFVFVNSPSIGVEPTFNSIYIIYKSSSKILQLIKNKQLVNIERLACCCGCISFVFICFC